MKTTTFLLASACSALLTCVPATAQSIGVSAAVNQSARGIRPGASVRTIVIGDNVVYNERIETDPIGLLQILLADGTTFTVGPNSALSIDRFVYDPAAGTAEVTASLTKGVFRFIGGKTSKTPGGVKLDTPVGTIGIRGGVGTVEVGESEVSAASIHGRLDFRPANGSKSMVVLPGYMVKATVNADGSLNTKVQKTPPGYTASTVSLMSGSTGRNGGATDQPDTKDVTDSRIANSNSNVPTSLNTPFLVTTVPTSAGETERQESQTVQNVSVDIVNTDVAQQQAAQQQIAQQGTADPIPSPPIPTARPDPIAVPVRVVTAGDVYRTLFDDVYPNPGAQGLIGGTSDTDESLVLLQQPDTTFASGSSSSGQLTLPLYADGAFQARNVTAADGAILGGVPLLGTVYTGNEGFALYTLAMDGDATRPLYALKGTATVDSSVLRDGDVRVYSFGTDLLQAIDVPFMRADALGNDYSNAAITPFYLAEEKPGLDASSRLFQSWLLIEGSGAAQRSGIGVNVGDMFEFDGVFQTDFGRRGSYRASTTSVSSQLTSPVTTIAGPGGGNETFGSNGQNMVLGFDFVNGETFGDRAANRSGGADFGTVHALNLTSESSTAQFLAANDATKNLGPSSGNNRITGFSAGVVEGRYTNGASIFAQGVSGSDPEQTVIEFDAEYNSLAGELEIGTADVTTRVAFGEGVGSNTRNGQSSYITDDIYGATQNNNPTRTYYRELNGNGGTVRNFTPIADNNTKTYFVSGDAVPQPDLLAGGSAPDGKMCDCSFLEWGWWGTQIRGTSNPSGAPNREDVRVGVHLGTWVAGDITTTAQLAPLAGSTATYEGRALGNVTAATSNGTANYVAAGLMDMSYDFGAGSGTMTIQGFDGRDFSGGMTGASTGSATFGGELDQSNIAANGSPNASGVAQGAFVNNGANIAQGVIGNFSVTNGSDWSAVGITAGNQSSFTP